VTGTWRRPPTPHHHEGLRQRGEQFNLDCGGASPRFPVLRPRPPPAARAWPAAASCPDGRCTTSWELHRPRAVILYVDGTKPQKEPSDWQRNSQLTLPMSHWRPSIRCGQSHTISSRGYLEEVAVLRQCAEFRTRCAAFQHGTNTSPTFLVTRLVLGAATPARLFRHPRNECGRPNGDAITMPKVTVRVVERSGDGALTGKPYSVDVGTKAPGERDRFLGWRIPQRYAAGRPARHHRALSPANQLGPVLSGRHRPYES